MQVVFVRFPLLGGLLLSFTPAKADFWSKHNPLRQLTPHWGPLIPHPQSGQELLPPCVGSPQNCRDKNMPGDTKQPGVSPSPSGDETEEAVCVCPSEAKNAVAWFTHKPSRFSAIGVPINVHTASCDVFISCPSGSFVNWTGSMHSLSWSTSQNTNNGYTIWLLHGSID
jgi:hypothetical protein